MNQKYPGERRLAIRARKTHSPDSSPQQDHFVHCPRQARSVPLEDCVACAFCTGAVFDRKSERYFLTCVPDPSGAEPTAVSTASGPPLEGASTAGLTLVSSIMTTDVHCVAAELSVEALTILFLEHNISGAPVVDGDGKPIGMVSKTDLVREAHDNAGTEVHEPLKLRTKKGYEIELGPGFHAERIARSTVGEIMMPIAFLVSETSTVAQAAALMAVEGVHRVPVVSKEGVVVGIVSAIDILRFVARENGYLRG